MLYPLSKPPLMMSVMTAFPFTIEPSENLARAKEMMAEHNFHHLPVASQGELLGVLSDRDIRWALDPVFDLGREEQVLVESVYTKNVFTCDLHARLADVLVEMSINHFGSVLVTKQGKLAGIFTYTDACRQFGEYLQQRFPVGPGDEVA